MNDKLTALTDLVNEGRALLSPTSDNPNLAAESKLLCEYIEAFVGFVPCDADCTHEGRAALAIMAVPYFIRNRLCICQNCLNNYSEGDRFLFLCLRARVLVETGKSSLMWPHVETDGQWS